MPFSYSSDRERPLLRSSHSPALKSSADHDENNMRQLRQPHDTPDATTPALLSPPHPLHPATSLAHLTPDVTHTNVSGITNRAELIERIKAGETPTWIPNRNVRSLLRVGDGGGDDGCGGGSAGGGGRGGKPYGELSSIRTLADRSWNLKLSDRYYPNHTPSSTPRPTDEHPDRPQSALHQGIFTNEARSSQSSPGSHPTAANPFRSCALTGRTILPPPLQTAFPRHEVCPPGRRHVRTPSLSSNFVLTTPTSPLVYSSNPDTDGSSDESARPIDIGFSERRARRKSLPPSALSTLQFSPTKATSIRSQTFSAGTPNNPGQWDEPSVSPKSRRLSGMGGTLSELPFGSFVGSYEESILNGRMSTTPSKPLNFVAQIGVLGFGKCKQSLRCPAHVTLSFPAYFYSVGDYDSPSPYVGSLDLDSALGVQSGKGKKSPSGVGGSYRIPQRGQLQIVIKNPHKTAVKLFLVPYDLRDMEPGTKTFIRQKSYSVGEVGGDIPVNATMAMTRGKEKDSLRYLIHMHIVCPSRGRYYLFKSIRVVFANRVPDGKERLRNETLWPEPKFSIWKAETTTPTAKGRQRSTSLYGVAMGGDMLPPLPLSTMPPPPSAPDDYAKNVQMDLDERDAGSDTSGGGTYEKLDLSSSTNKVAGEGRGLLAKKLKQLEVEKAATQ